MTGSLLIFLNVSAPCSSGKTFTASVLHRDAGLFTHKGQQVRIIFDTDESVKYYLINHLVRK